MRNGRRPIITLTTDFGTADGYVAAMKGVILGINSEATIVDLTHEIRAQDIFEGAFIFGSTFDAFPPDTIHVVVVDPGVGSARRPVAISTPTGTFVAPDNGVLSWALRAAETDEWPAQAREMKAPASAQAIELNNPKYWRHRVSSTFHGRDVFAPAAAHRSRGVSLHELGDSIEALRLFPVPRARFIQPKHMRGHVVHVDRFGNLITDVTEDDLVGLTAVTIGIGGETVPRLVTHYAAGEAAGSTLIALIGSAGFLEVAVVQGSAAATLGVGTGETVEIVDADANG